MATSIAEIPRSAASLRAGPPAAEDRQILRISGVLWKDYLAFLRLFESHRGYRLTYDRGELEIMSPSQAHDDDSRFLELLVFLLIRGHGLAMRLGGSTTLKKKLDERGIEPDNCFWIANAHRISRKRKFDLRRDPPPDLAIEVDVTSSSLDRMALYAAFGIPELWRLDADTLTFYELRPDNKYAEITTSRSFPGIASADLMRFVEMSRETDNQIEVTTAFERWLDERLANEQMDQNKRGSDGD